MEELVSEISKAPYPQQRTFDFENLTVTSDFDSGNLSNAELFGVEDAKEVYHLWIGNDAFGSEFVTVHRSWFYFRAKCRHAAELVFILKNLNCQLKLYNEGLRPYFKKVNDPIWLPVTNKYTYKMSTE
jgi:hypothetical protein